SKISNPRSRFRTKSRTNTRTVKPIKTNMGKLIMNNNWKTSVTELLVISRGALLAIIPWLEKAKIKWKEDEAYDDWDNIAESLYANIVCSSLIGEVATEYQITKYNFNYDNYSSVNFIEVRNKD